MLDGYQLPKWVDLETRFLVVLDVALGAATRIPTILRLHKPDQRLFLTEDPLSVRRWILAPIRSRPFEGIIDAYVFGDLLTAFLGDLTIRSFPLRRIRSLEGLSQERLKEFEIDIDGSFLFWPEADAHLGPSQLLQAVDPSELAQIEIERHRMENTAAALRHMREERGLRQTDIKGLSERQISRLENAESRLTADAAEKWAAAFDLDLPSFLEELGYLLREWKDQQPTGPVATNGLN